MLYNDSEKMFTLTAKPIQITGEPDNQDPDKWSVTVMPLKCQQLLTKKHGITMQKT
jgi:hypothetical protein